MHYSDKVRHISINICTRMSYIRLCYTPTSYTQIYYNIEVIIINLNASQKVE